MMNLLSNSLKFTLKGYIKIIVKLDPANDNILLISVSDTGVGIPPLIQSKLFKLYGTFD